MHRHYWLFRAALVGCIAAFLLAGVSLGQEVNQHVLKGQPESKVQKAPNSESAHAKGGQSNTQPEALTPALRQIESAIREIVNQQRSAQAKEPSNHQRSDLEAQQNMVFWAQLMFVATAVAVVLTGVGIWLIKRTLDETKVAAEYAGNSLKEASKTTIAAVEAAKEARRQADIAELSIRNLERPYLFPEVTETSFLRGNKHNKPFLRYRFINQGRTPAIVQSVSVRLVSNAKLPLRLPLHIKTDVYEIVAPRDCTTANPIDVEGSKIGDSWIGVDATKLIFHGSVRYVDAAGAQYNDTFCLRGTENADGFVMVGGEAQNSRTSVGPSLEIERLDGQSIDKDGVKPD